MKIIRLASNAGALSIALAIVLLTGCAATNVYEGERLDASARWAQLPIANYAETPQAGRRAQSILATLLHQRGIGGLAAAPSGDRGGLPEFDDSAAYERALQWAREQGYRYGVAGAVEEWQYKAGLDGEPAVGVTLRVVDVASGATLWSASGARSGWGYSTVSGTAQELMGDLVDDLPLQP